MNDVIFGTRRQGKSTLATGLAIERNKRVAIFDPNGQFPLIQSISIGELAGWLEDTLDEDGEVAPGYHIIRVGPFDTPEVEERFAEFSEILFAQPNLSIIVDEGHMLQGFNYIDPNLDRWQRRSPASVLVVVTTHRIVDAHADTRYHADNVFFFFTDDELELRTIKKKYGSEIADQVERLKLHQVLHFWRETGGYRKWAVWDDGSEWYINLENQNKVMTNAQ